MEHGRQTAAGTPFEFAQDAPLEVDGAHRVGVGEVGHKFEARVVRAHLQGQGALGRGRHKDHGVEDVHMQVGQVEVQPLHACMGQHDGVVLALPKLADARRNVAAKGLDREVGLPKLELPTTTHRRRAHHGASPHLQRRGEVDLLRTNQQDVFNGSARRDGCDDQPCGWCCFEVLVAVHRKVYVAVEQGLFDLLREEPFAFHLVEADVLDAVATRLHHDNLHTRAARFKQIADVARLPHGEVASACSDLEMEVMGHGQR